MTLDEFTTALYNEMEKRLAELRDKESNTILLHRNLSASILPFILRLKIYISSYRFNSNIEEIDFFKNIKPKFFSKLVYHQKIFEIYSRLPLASTPGIKIYYEKELNRINEYLNNNNEFVTYYRTNASHLDNIYFIRQEPDSWMILNFEDYETDLNFTTIYDYKVSKIIAYELLSAYIINSINKLDSQAEKTIPAVLNNEQKISWTGSKASLIELLYALQSSGSCNNGTVDLKQLAQQLEASFNIDLGNYYRVFQEIRIRKINRTAFLDQLKERLIQRMDETDLNPKFK